MNNTQQELFEILFRSDVLLDTFNTKYADTKVRGYDALSGEHVKNRAEEVFQNVSRKCLDSNFRFTPYKEKLILKNRYSTPRMTSIPTVRDRVVLKHLNSFLKKTYSEISNHSKPKKAIEPIIEILKNNQSNDIWVYSGDLKKFFDTIPHERLLDVLSKRIQVNEILNLIRRAIKTPTLPVNTPKSTHHKYTNVAGVPQGTSIAGSLAAIYMLEVDRAIAHNHPDIKYCRYVDDILLLGKKDNVKAAQKTLHNLVINMGLELHTDEKEHFEPITTQFQFLGYQFQLLSDNKLTISVRQSSINRVYIRFLSMIKETVQGYKNFIFLQTKGFYSESSIYDFDLFLLRLNARITGFVTKDTNEYRGWLSYYIQINDLKLLYQFDSFVKNKLIEHGLDEHLDMNNVKSFVRAYHESRHALYKDSYIPHFTNKEAQEYGIIDDLDANFYSN